jgi:hypothetical protein
MTADMLLALFLHPARLVGWQCALLLLPLSLAIAIVYKTIKCAEVREIPLASFILWITIIVGMYAVGITLMILYELFA